MTIPFYKVINKLSSGAFGIVWLVDMDNKEYALKTVKIHEEYMNREESIIKTLEHKNIVQYINSWVENSTLHIVMECLPTTLR